MTRYQEPTMKVAQFFISFFLTCHASQTSNSELLALKGLFAVTGGLNGSWVNSSGWDNHGSIDPCGWYGVVCNSTTSNSTTRVNVAGLFLSTNGLKGVIPSSHLTELSLLGHLDLSKNSFTGALPSDICALGSSLRYLGFWGNSLIGTIPTCYGNSFTNLNGLSLESNRLTGRIPSSIGNIGPSLKTVWLYKNFLTGTLPSMFSSLTGLETFDARSNKLSGTLDGVCTMNTNIRNLILWDNSMNGQLPECIGELANLEVLALGGNSLSGTIPSNFCNKADISGLSSGLSSRPLRWILLSANKLTGTLPSCIGGLSDLSDFQVNDNLMTGILPQTFCALQTLKVFAASSNSFKGTIPGCYGASSWPYLDTFEAHSTQLQGTIPASFCGGALKKFEVYGNRLTGSIPPCFGTSLPMLVGLQVQDNRLTGMLPPQWNSPALSVFVASNNRKMGGKLPLTLFTNCPELKSLVVEGTLLSGKLSALGAFDVNNGGTRNLETLALSGNKLTGPLPRNLSHLGQLVTFQAPSNRLSGPIPENIGSLTSLRRLLLSGNLLSGTVPESLGLLSPQLERVDLELNRLSCGLPLKVVNWRGFNGTKYDTLKERATLGEYQTSSGTESTDEKNYAKNRRAKVSLLEGNLFKCPSRSKWRRFFGAGSSRDFKAETSERGGSGNSEGGGSSTVAHGGSKLAGASPLYQQDRNGASYRCEDSPYAPAALASVGAGGLCLAAILVAALSRVFKRSRGDKDAVKDHYKNSSSRAKKIAQDVAQQCFDELSPNLGWWWRQWRHKMAQQQQQHAEETGRDGRIHAPTDITANQMRMSGSRIRSASSAWRNHRMKVKSSFKQDQQKREQGDNEEGCASSTTFHSAQVELKALDPPVIPPPEESDSDPQRSSAGQRVSIGSGGVFSMASGLVWLGVGGVGALTGISVGVALPAIWFGSTSSFTCQYLGRLTFAYKSSLGSAASVIFGCALSLATLVVSRPVWWIKDGKLVKPNLPQPRASSPASKSAFEIFEDTSHDGVSPAADSANGDEEEKEIQQNLEDRTQKETPNQLEEGEVGEASMADGAAQTRSSQQRRSRGFVSCIAASQVFFCAVLTTLPNVAYVLVLLDSNTTASAKALAQLAVTLAKVVVSSVVVPKAAQYTLSALQGLVEGPGEVVMAPMVANGSNDDNGDGDGFSRTSNGDREKKEVTTYDDQGEAAQVDGSISHDRTGLGCTMPSHLGPEFSSINTTTFSTTTATAAQDYSSALVYRRRVVVEIVHAAISLVGIPMAVVLCVDPRCFYYALAPPRSVTTTVYTPFCTTEATDGKCLGYGSSAVDSTYEFRFELEPEICIVALFETYVPVFIAAPVVSAALDVVIGEFLLPWLLRVKALFSRQRGVEVKEMHNDITPSTIENADDDSGGCGTSVETTKKKKAEARWATSHWLQIQEQRLAFFPESLLSSTNHDPDNQQQLQLAATTTLSWLEGLEEELVVVARELAERCRRRLLLLLLYGCTFGLGAALVATACLFSAVAVLTYHLHLLGRVHALATLAVKYRTKSPHREFLSQGVAENDASSRRGTANENNTYSSAVGDENSISAVGLYNTEDRVLRGRLRGWDGFAPRGCGICLGVTALLFWGVVAVTIVDVLSAAIGCTAIFVTAFICRWIASTSSPLKTFEHYHHSASYPDLGLTSQGPFQEGRLSLAASSILWVGGQRRSSSSSGSSIRGENNRRSTDLASGDDVDPEERFSRFNPMAEETVSELTHMELRQLAQRGQEQEIARDSISSTSRKGNP